MEILLVSIIVLLLALSGAAAFWWFRRDTARESAIGVVTPGEFEALHEEMLGSPAEWAERLGLEPVAEPSVPTAPEAGAGLRGPSRRYDIGTGLLAGGAESTALAADWAHVDSSVLEGFARYTGQETASILDIREKGLSYEEGASLDGWMNGLRGHVGEQEVFAQLESWLGDGLVIPEHGNHPGFDVEILGQEANVKVTSDVANAASEHFARYPDIPLIVNADASGIPDSAVHLDLSEPFDPSILGEENLVIVAEGLELSGIMDSIQDLTEFGELGGAIDGLPGVGFVVAATRSSIRETKLLQIHQDKARVVKNIALDTGLIGGGGLAGAKAGAVAGAAVDAAFLGTTLGMGTLVGGMIGAMGGGTAGALAAKQARTAEYRARQEKLQQALDRYGQVLARVEQRTAERWQTVLSDTDESLRADREELIRLRDQIMAEAALQFQQASDLSPADRDLLIVAARQRVDQAVAQEGTELAKRRAAGWEEQAARAGDDLSRVMDVVLASPGGREAVQEWLTAAELARDEGLRTLAAGRELVRAMALQSRMAAAERLNARRERIQQRARARMECPLSRVRQASQAVEEEAHALGMESPGTAESPHERQPAMSG